MEFFFFFGGGVGGAVGFLCFYLFGLNILVLVRLVLFLCFCLVCWF